MDPGVNRSCQRGYKQASKPIKQRIAPEANIDENDQVLKDLILLKDAPKKHLQKYRCRQHYYLNQNLHGFQFRELLKISI